MRKADPDALRGRRAGAVNITIDGSAAGLEDRVVAAVNQAVRHRRLDYAVRASQR